MKRQNIFPPLIMTSSNQGKNFSHQKLVAIFNDIVRSSEKYSDLAAKHGVSPSTISKYK